MIILFVSGKAGNAACFINCRVHHLRADASLDLPAILNKASGMNTNPHYGRKTVSREPAVIVLDRAGLSGKKYDALINEIKNEPVLCWAVLDSKGQVNDPASLFFMGACDYLSPFVAAGGVRVSRLEQRWVSQPKTGNIGKPVKSVITVKTGKADNVDNGLKNEKIAADFPGWSRIQEGTEYSFLFLYADLPEAEGIRKTLGEKRYIRLKEDFAVSMNSLVHQADGRIWMISGHSLLALLPPANADKALRICIETLIGSSLFIYEQLHLTSSTPLSFSLHLGTSLWQKPGKTGHIISADVNFIYHLGHKYAGKNLLNVSGRAYDRIGETGKRFLKHKGEFENHVIYCSRRFGCSSFAG